MYESMYVCMYAFYPFMQGSAGAYEISGRMTAMLGWAGTADFKEKWVFDGAAER